MLANLPDKEVDSNWKWITLAELISHIEKKRGRIPLEVMLLHIEEMSRADCSMIDEILASKLLEGTIAEQYLGILGMHQFSKKNNISNSIKEKLENIDLPDGDSLIRRIRNKTLE